MVCVTVLLGHGIVTYSGHIAMYGINTPRVRILRQPSATAVLLHVTFLFTHAADGIPTPSSCGLASHRAYDPFPWHLPVPAVRVRV
jgi:hypothetical protein